MVKLFGQTPKPQPQPIPLPSFLSSLPPSTICSSQWINPQCIDICCVTLDENKISSLSTCNMFSEIKLKNSFFAAFKIQKIAHFMSLGIADISYITKKYLTFKQNHALEYVNNGAFMQAMTKLNRQNIEHRRIPFFNTHIVEVIGNFNDGWIEWRINGSICCRVQLQILRDKDIEWVFWVWFGQKNNVVQILASVDDVLVLIVDLCLGMFSWDQDLLHDICVIGGNDGKIEH